MYWSHSGDVSTGCLCTADVKVVMFPLDVCVLVFFSYYIPLKSFHKSDKEVFS